MGAVHKLDLTSEVTHLFVGNINTPKYRYVAKERPDIKVLHPDWLEAVRQAWMNGDDVDVEALEQQYRLPVFSGLTVCITGFDDHDQRSFISDTVQEKGAAYHGDLTRSITHLIAAAPQGAKYTHAKQWGINVVSLKWFEDGLRRGMSLDESLYDPAMPLEAQGKGAFRERVVSRTSLGKRERDADSQSAGDASKRKLRRTASTRLNSQSQDLWQDMSARDTETEPVEKDQWKNGDRPDETVNTDGDASLARPETVPPADASAAYDHDSLATSRSHARAPSVFQHTADSSHGPEGLFAGLYVLIHGFPPDKKHRLQQFLEPNGARIVHSSAELQDAPCEPLFKDRYLLVPHASEEPLELPAIPSGAKLVTEWWVERCIHYKRTLDPSEDALSRVFGNLNISGFENLTICATGFSGVDVRQIAEAVKLMGAQYEEKLTPSITVLISRSNSVRKEKAYYASKHGIPVVSQDWLWQCLKGGGRASYEKFRVKLPAFDQKEGVSEPSTSSPASADATRRRLDGVRRTYVD